MGTSTPNYAFYKPDGTDPVDNATDLNANWDRADAHAHSGTYERVFMVGAGAGTDIQAAIDAASAAGGGEVITSPFTTYLTDLRMIPGETVIAAGIWMRSNVKLTFGRNSVLKLQNDARLPVGATQAHIISTLKPYATTVPLTKSNIILEEVVVDGNGNAQGFYSAAANAISSAIFVGSTRGAWLDKCRVQNFYGTLPGPPGETFHFEINNSRDVHLTDCEADGSGATDTATGFSTDNSFGITWTGCIAHDLAHGQGFTNWQSAGLRYEGCHAYNCPNAGGFNAERSEDVTYDGCVSGGRTPNPGADPALPWFTTNQVVGNKVGFQISGCTDVALDGCVGTYNTTYGLHVYSNTGASPTLPCTNVTWTGGSLLNNGVDTTTNAVIDPGQSGVWVGPTPMSGGDIINYKATAPLVYYEAVNGNSGLRYLIRGFAGETFRIQTIGGNQFFRIKGGSEPAGGDSNRTDRAGDTTVTYGFNAESVATKYKTGAGVTTIADTDFAHQPPDGAMAFVKDSSTGIVYRCVRVDGAWWVIPDVAPVDLTSAQTIAGVKTFTSSPIFPDLGSLASGEGNMPFDSVNNAGVPTGNQSLRLRYFTAKKTETITQAKVTTGGTAAGATPTLVRVGIWTADAAGALLAQVGATPNDTSLLAATQTDYTKALSASWNKVAGTRYASGLLVVTGATAPVMWGMSTGNTIAGHSPKRGGLIGGSADLPASAAAGAVADGGNMPYIEFIP